MPPPFLVLERLDKRFGELRVIRELSLAVAEGEVLALLGPSGSGKTTALRLLAGFEQPDGGSIRVAGAEVSHLPPAARGCGMVFQHYALFPHLTVGENVAFGLASRRLPRAEIAARVERMLALVDLAGFAARRVGEISGGQQQRVALARALAPEPRLLLLDEPLSNLDPALRERTRRELRKAIRRVGITTVLVTHEQEEAFDLGDRVAVLHRGVLDQVGSPEELYAAPATRFVATFVGRASVLPGRLAAAVGSAGGGEAGTVAVTLDGCGGATWPAVPAPACGGLPAGAEVDLVVRPEALRFAPAAGLGSAVGEAPSAGRAAALAGRVTARRYAGPVTFYSVRLDENGPDGANPDDAGLEDNAVDAEGTLAAPGRELEVAVPESSGPPAAAPGDAVAVTLGGGPPPRLFPRSRRAP
jgi:ABC-type Fe3+/spermidine/putrescine transport system ATPase subunit